MVNNRHSSLLAEQFCEVIAKDENHLTDLHT
jgi:hypothetical protein